ncbi:VPS10 domain-containing protein [Robertkochia flava]|uniref:VPS10 domain-containing protein n=1 Tax=Robertkochia flava TaxID=3447986 RepID=UPI001CD03DA8|nr:hypothetical protein [Robertkochia marina]
MRLTLLLLIGFTIGVKAQALDFGKLENLKIRNVGPANMSGRITAIDVDLSNPKMIFVGAASGGVWRSVNGGSAWSPVFDDQPTQNIGAIAIDQNNPEIIWVGTGEGNPRNSMNLGMGIFKSEDGGKTWQHMGLEGTRSIHRIIVHPDSSNIIYVGAMGDPFTPGEHRGLYRSADGGEHWEKILYSNTTSGIGDMVMDRQNPDKIIAALYEHRRTPYSFTSGGPGSGLYLTLDGGDTWKRIGPENGLPEGDLGRIGVAIAPSDPQRVYAKIEAVKNALYRSNDGGLSWELVNDDPKFTNNRPFYFQDLAVDSKDPDRLYNIYQPLSVSYDGGVSFDPAPMIPADETKGIHADFHAFWVNPEDPQHFMIGGDGGLGITYDHGKSWYFPETIPVAQFYHVNADHDTPFNVYGGMQDNGNWSGPAYTWKRGGIRTLYWQYLVGGDGFYIAPDEDNSRFGYGTSQNGDLYRYDKLTGYYVSIAPQPPSPDTPLRFNWNAAFAKDPWNESGAYYGSQYVHKTSDKGASWEIISPDLSTNNPAHQKGDYGGLTLDVSGAENYNSILTISPSAIEAQVIWAGTDDGQVHLTRDGGRSWKNLTANIDGLPQGAWITRIYASRYEKGAAWMVVNNYRKGDYAPYLFKTTDFGKQWQRMADEQDVRGYALSFIQDPVEKGLVFLGTEHGLWVSINEGEDWTAVPNGFPSVATTDLVIQERESALIIGTFGRAIWVLDDLLSLREIAAGRTNKPITALPMNPVVQVKGLFIAPPGNIWTGFHTTFEGENRSFQKAEIPFYINRLSQTDSVVSAVVYNAQGAIVNEVEQTQLKEGLNYITWKLDERATVLPGTWITEESRGIPVVPGNYKVELRYGEYRDNVEVKVVADPRFELPAAVDEALYQYQKAVDTQVSRLSALMQQMSKQREALGKMEAHYKKSGTPGIPEEVRDLSKALEALEQTLKPGPGDRQVGAWQTNKVSAYSSTVAAQKAAIARTTLPSEQDWKRLDMAENLTTIFEEKYHSFNKDLWEPFKTRYQEVNREWFE